MKAPACKIYVRVEFDRNKSVTELIHTPLTPDLNSLKLSENGWNTLNLKILEFRLKILEIPEICSSAW